MQNLIGFRVHNGFFMLALVAFFISGITDKAVAQKLPPADVDKLQKAQRLAERVFAETGNAAGGVKVLEESGITELVQQRVAGVPRDAYVGLLETYASLLAQLPERRREAAGLLKAVVETDPERASAYLHLGNLYYQLYQAEPKDQYRTVYIAAYRKYVDRLRKQKQHILLSSPVIEAAYSSEGLDICIFTGRLLQEQQLADLNLFFNPETEISEMTKTEAGKEGEPGASFTGFISGSAGVIRKSLIDIDNDGHPETWYSAATMMGNCQRNVFYRHMDGQSAVFSNDLLDSYYRPDRICKGSQIFFVRYLQQNYLLEQHPLKESGLKTVIFRLTPAGDYLQLCTLQSPEDGEIMKN